MLVFLFRRYFTFRYSTFTFRYSTFTFRYSTFTFRYSTFTFCYSTISARLVRLPSAARLRTMT